MSDTPSTPATKTSQQLRAEREALAAETARQLRELDNRIWDTQRAETQAVYDALISQFVPGLDRSKLRGRDIVFLIHKSKDMGSGNDSNAPLGAALNIAADLRDALHDADATVSARLWGNGVGEAPEAKLKRPFIYEATNITAGDFYSVAKQLRDAPASTDRTKHYIVISDGNIDADARGTLRRHTMELLTDAAWRKDVRATYDFITVNPGETELGTIAKQWSKSVKHSSAARVRDASGIKDAVIGLLKARVADERYTPPEMAPPPPPPAPEPPAPTPPDRSNLVIKENDPVAERPKAPSRLQRIRGIFADKAAVTPPKEDAPLPPIRITEVVATPTPAPATPVKAEKKPGGVRNWLGQRFKPKAKAEKATTTTGPVDIAKLPELVVTPAPEKAPTPPPPAA